MQKAACALIVSALIGCGQSLDNHREAPTQFTNSSKIAVSAESLVNCDQIKRPLNPSEKPSRGEKELDKHFRLAFYYESAGNFDSAIEHYRAAENLAICDCDRAHALAGIMAAAEAKEIFQQEGINAKPTQYFWGRLQDLTQDLPCVDVQ
ncbi:hypothetical protein Misp06_02931 [Microbulbifer sp. NBRC 101763]|uniref:hypothetical protein n=1 Tax=Microbulbifer sp. NBRC 101763 TaxID=1113820 RepID=UPI0030A0302D